MKKILLIIVLGVVLAFLIFDLVTWIWGSYLVTMTLGTAVSFYIFTYTIRNTIFRNNKKKRVWIYSAAILAILAPPHGGNWGC